MDITVAWWVTWVLGALPLLIGVIWWWNDLYYMVTLRARCSATGTKLPPGYLGIPFLGELPTFLWYFKVLRRPDDFINSKRHRYGDRVGMYRTHLFGFPSIIACSPAITKFIFRSDDQFPYRWPTNDLVGHNSIISVSGQRHDRLRRFLSIAINQPEALRRIATHVQPRIAAALQAWAEKGTVVAYDEVKKVTFENIGKLFASIEPGPLLDSLGYNFEGMVKGMRAQPFNIPGTAYHHALKCRRKLEAIFRKELEKRKHGQNGSETAGDLMDGLMKLKDEEGEKLSNEEVIDNMASLVVGGFESTVLSSMWAIYYLAKFPNVLHKLREENNYILREKKGEFLTRDDVSQLKYTNKVAEEAIRLANVSAFVFRSGDKDVEYKGYKIPKGWKVICWLRYLHTDPDNFEDPMCFNPDRWDKPAKPGTHHTFGGGSRYCVGDMLARMQLALLIHHLAVGYKWELINPDAQITYLPSPKPADGAKISITKV